MKTANEHFVTPPVVNTEGDRSGGGADLTPLGRDVLKHFRQMEQRALKAIAKDVSCLETLIRR